MKKFSLFSVYGIEIEYMIVKRESLDVLPVTDKVMREIAGKYVSDVERGAISWSNELALHVIELKTTYPQTQLISLDGQFHNDIHVLNQILGKFDALLMPTGMHPWMDPYKEIKLWPHECSPIYEAFNRIFDCRGHGWSNVQSTHLNIPFANDEEFVRLHTAIRVLLPILPALSASSPICDGQVGPALDQRLNVYRNNSKKIPTITGKVIPELVSSKEQYKREILDKMYRDISPFDPDKVLQDEWLNSRGAIARFDRNTIEIRLLDTQECPLADIAIVCAIIGVLKALVSEKWCSLAELQKMDLDILHDIFLACVTKGEQAEIDAIEYLKIFGYLSHKPIQVKKLWDLLIDETIGQQLQDGDTIKEALNIIQKQGPLARRILVGCQGNFSHQQLNKVYGELCKCLAANRQYTQTT